MRAEKVASPLTAFSPCQGQFEKKWHSSFFSFSSSTSYSPSPSPSSSSSSSSSSVVVVFYFSYSFFFCLFLFFYSCSCSYSYSYYSSSGDLLVTRTVRVAGLLHVKLIYISLSSRELSNNTHFLV